MALPSMNPSRQPRRLKIDDEPKVEVEEKTETPPYGEWTEAQKALEFGQEEPEGHQYEPIPGIKPDWDMPPKEEAGDPT